MTTELTMLSLAVLLTVIQLGLVMVPALGQLGISYLAGARDEGRTLTGSAARLLRALDNMVASLLLFAIAVIVAHLAGVNSAVTALSAQIYLAARIVYIPLYYFGIPWARTLIWAVGLIATLVILAAPLF